MSNPKHSPFNYQPRNRVQSINEQIHRLIYDFVAGPAALAFFFLGFAALEWLRYYRPYRAEPIVYSMMAGIVLSYTTIRMWKVWPRVRALKLARDGEKAIGQSLDSLRQRGYRIFHDLAGKDFNLDHVLVGPAGIFTLETKMQDKALQSNAPVIFDGEKIRVKGCEPQRDTIVRAKRHARWLRGLLAECTDQEFDVHPVIVYAGGSVEWKGPKNHSIWVLNPKWLPSFMDHEPLRLSSEHIELASFHLSRFARAG